MDHVSDNSRRLSRRRVVQGASIFALATGLGASTVPTTAAAPPVGTPVATPGGSPAASATPSPPTMASPAATPGTAATVRVTADPRFPDHAEPSLAVNPRNPANLLGAAQFFAGPGPHPVIGTFVSFDGGATWHDQAPLPLPAGANVGDDVTVAFAPDGHGFVAAMVDSSQTGLGVAVWRTDDGGQTFGSPVRVAQSGGDHPWLTADPDTGALYVAWSGQIRQQLLFSRSTDGGHTFTPAQVISGPDDVHPTSAVVAAGRSGTVSVIYGPTEVVTSTDGGHTFSPHSRPVVQPPSQTDRALPTLQAAAADPASGMLYVATAAPQAATGHQAILLLRSADGGRTWADPVPVPLDSTHQADAYQPALAVSQSGQVVISAYLVSNGRVSVALAWSADQGKSFTVVPAIARSFRPSTDLTPASKGHFGKGGNLPWIGDYQGLAAGATAAYPCWTDTSTGHMDIFVSVVPLPQAQRAASGIVASGLIPEHASVV